MCGESLDCPNYSQFIEEVLKPLMEEYEPQNIYNADETSLFYKSLSNRTMSFDSEQVHGSKLHQSKDHMSLLLCTNMNGSEKLNPVLIGKAAHPTALKKHGVTVKDLGVEYFWNQKGWMTGPVFDLWLTDWNNNLIRQNCHVLLLIDNAPGHVIGEYSNIRIQFLPPNTTAKLQPLDQGIIKSTKHNYRTILTTRYLAGVESKQEAKTIMKSFDFVVACQVLVEAWDALTPENIQKCFSKAGFMPYVEHEPEAYAEPPQKIWDNLQRVLGVNVPFADYTTHDDRVESSERMDDAAIVEAVASECETVAVDENEDPDASDSEEGVVEHDGDETRQAWEEEIIKTSTEFLRSISQQKAYILRNKLPKSLLKELSNIENAIVASKAKSCNTQTKLLSFFRH